MVEVSARAETGIGRCRFVGTLVLVAGLAIGCGSVSFKRGASPEAIGADEKACRASTDNDERYVECMKQRGYLVGE